MIIKPTMIYDPEIARQAVIQATTTPTSAGMERANRCKDLWLKLSKKGKQ